MAKILCVDVGRGTQDVLLYDHGKTIENCISLIIPSRATLLEEALRKAVGEGKTPLFRGVNMGGFPLNKHVQKFLRSGKKILATQAAAKTFHDNLDLLLERGFKLVSEQEADKLKNSPEILSLRTRDIDFETLRNVLLDLGDDARIDGFAVAVQDHGEAPPGVSNREFRFTQHRKILETNPRLTQMGFTREEIPKVFTRMRAVNKCLPLDNPLLIMDTGWAAILGALEDQRVAGKRYKLVVNLGNAHALAAYLDGDNVLGIWEHHTKSLDAHKLDNLLIRLAEGTISHEDVFADGGHGAFVREIPAGGMSNIEITALTGPNRMLFANKQHYLAAPHGNMMLSGSFGLLRAYLSRYNFEQQE